MALGYYKDGAWVSLASTADVDGRAPALDAWEAGEGWGSIGRRGSPGGLTDAREYAWPLYIPNGAGIDGINANIATAGSAGSVVRLGLRRDDNLGWPGSLIVDGGTADATTTGTKSVVVDVPSSEVSNSFVWLVAVSQGAPDTGPSFGRFSSEPIGRFGAMRINFVSHDSSIYFARSRDGVTGALDNTLTGWNYSNVAPSMRVKLQ